MVIIHSFLNTCFCAESYTCIRIQSISHRAFSLKQRNSLQDKQSLHDLPGDETPKSSGLSSSDSHSQACSSLGTSTNAGKSSESRGKCLLGNLGRKTPRRTRDKDFDAIGQLKEFPYVSLSSTEKVRAVSDYVGLQMI